jgi:hypothetical protein
MIRRTTFVFVCAFCSIQAAKAAERTQDSLASFTIDGLKIGDTTLKQFKAKYQGICLSPNDSETDMQIGMEEFVVLGIPDELERDGIQGILKCDAVGCGFIDGKLYRIRVEYLAQRFEHVGGVDRAVQVIATIYHLSSPTSHVALALDDGASGHEHTWESTESYRRAELRVRSSVGIARTARLADDSILEVTDTMAEAELARRRAGQRSGDGTKPLSETTQLSLRFLRDDNVRLGRLSLLVDAFVDNQRKSVQESQRQLDIAVIDGERHSRKIENALDRQKRSAR